LLIEDSEETVFFVKNALGAGFQLECVSRLEEADRLLKKKQYDVLLLDVVLPDGDGFRFCAALQDDGRTRAIPVIFLTAKSEIVDKVLGFSVGADDYIVKPFDPAELRARIQGKIRKLAQRKLNDDELVRGDLKIVLSFQRVVICGATSETLLSLTPTEFKLLYCFVQQEDRVLSREQLLNAVWGDSLHVVDRVVDKHISSLRQKIAASICKVETVNRLGYRFSVPKVGL
jgi:DNA-binding response OmpR family regulator